MTQPFKFWASATAAIAAAAMLGCGDDSDGQGDPAFTGAGTGGPRTAAGTTGAAAGTTGTPPDTSGAPTAGTTGTPTAGATGTPTAGTMSGAAGTMSGAAGTMSGAAGTMSSAAGTMSGAAGTMAGGGTGGTMAGGGGTGGTSGDGAGGTGAGGTGGGDQTATLCQPADSVDGMGPHTPTRIEDGPEGTWVFFPEDLGADGMKHPVFVWGPGAGTGPSDYVDHLNQIASHGFVVICQPSSGSGGPETAALDQLLAENDMEGSMFYQKLDTERVGMGGHSLGALTTMAMADDPRLSLYVLVCGGCMSGSGGCGAADIHAPTLILGGGADFATANFEGDYSEITEPVAFVTHSGADHISCARDNLPPWVAFMRWHFCGEDQWESRFFDGGEYCMSPWECKSKNF